MTVVKFYTKFIITHISEEKDKLQEFRENSIVTASTFTLCQCWRKDTQVK